jgi:hypothetical protein
VQQAVDQHRAVARRQDEAITVGPARLGGIELQELAKSTVATSAMPIGMPGWPLLAA